jgi:hypothetical protein
MTEFLLQNKANIDARTFGDEQAAIHYAAKNGAAQSLKVLLGYHADIDTLDANKKTPLQVSLCIIINLYFWVFKYSEQISVSQNLGPGHMSPVCRKLT